jgi:hypothetical protein
MLITKILDTCIDLATNAEIYCANVPEMLLVKLRERYAEKCFSSMLILEILEIIRYSDRIMVDNRLDGGAYINVQFKVKGMTLVKGEVVHGCKVSKVLNNNIIVKHQYITGNMAADPKRKIIGIIGLNQIIPVIVDDVRYNIGKSQITMMCKPYTPQPFVEIYYNIINNTHIEKLNEILDRIKEEEAIHEKISKTKVYGGFKTMVYPYKTARKFEHSALGAKFSTVSIKELLQSNSNANMCLTAVDFAVDNCILKSNEHISQSVPVTTVNAPLYVALSEILLNRLYYLHMLRGFVEYYDTPEKYQDMMAYWKVCASLKE